MLMITMMMMMLCSDHCSFCPPASNMIAMLPDMLRVCPTNAGICVPRQRLRRARAKGDVHIRCFQRAAKRTVSNATTNNAVLPVPLRMSVVCPLSHVVTVKYMSSSLCMRVWTRVPLPHLPRREVEVAVEKKKALLEGRSANLLLPPFDRRHGSHAVVGAEVGGTRRPLDANGVCRTGSVVHVVSRSSGQGGSASTQPMASSNRYAAALSAGANAIQQLQLQQQRFQIQIQMEQLRQQQMRLQALQAHGRQVAQQLLQAPARTRPPAHSTPP